MIGGCWYVVTCKNIPLSRPKVVNCVMMRFYNDSAYHYCGCLLSVIGTTTPRPIYRITLSSNASTWKGLHIANHKHSLTIFLCYNSSSCLVLAREPLQSMVLNANKLNIFCVCLRMCCGYVVDINCRWNFLEI